VGATGMVGQRFVTLLADHPWFQVVTVAASERSAGRTYQEAVAGRWMMNGPVPPAIGALTVKNASRVEEVAGSVDLIFCAVDMKKEEILALEESYARAETPVVSNNSANRWTPDVPMVLPELNPEHLQVIPLQRRRLGVKRGLIVVKPNCSIQSYVPALHALRGFGIERVFVCTYQAISGASKTFREWPEMVDNVIPYIGGEEEKSEREPLKIWGTVENDGIMNANGPAITSQCIRVPVTDGHMAAVFVSFEKKPPREKILEQWKGLAGKPQVLGLPSAPRPFLRYFTEDDRPQTRLDRDAGGCTSTVHRGGDGSGEEGAKLPAGMGITIGRLRDDKLLDYKFVCLSHNTIRGAAGGAILTAELLKAEGYIAAK
jgi:aspartate-semialdehyde dehydrogenase